MVKAIQLRPNPQKTRQAIHHINGSEIFVIKVKRGLLADLQPVQQPHLKILQRLQMFHELRRVKDGTRRFTPVSFH